MANGHNDEPTNWFWLSIEQIVILGVALGIAVKYLFFERRAQLKQELAVASGDSGAG